MEEGKSKLVEAAIKWMNSLQYFFVAMAFFLVWMIVDKLFF